MADAAISGETRDTFRVQEKRVLKHRDVFSRVAGARTRTRSKQHDTRDLFKIRRHSNLCQRDRDASFKERGSRLAAAAAVARVKDRIVNQSEEKEREGEISLILRTTRSSDVRTACARAHTHTQKCLYLRLLFSRCEFARKVPRLSPCILYLIYVKFKFAPTYGSRECVRVLRVSQDRFSQPLLA